MTAPALNTKTQTRSKERIKDLAEVLTAEQEVNAMLDSVGDITHKIEKTFL